MKPLPISQTPWKKLRFPRKLKKQLKKEKKLEVLKTLCRIANFGRKFSYKKVTEIYPNSYRIFASVRDTGESIQGTYKD